MHRSNKKNHALYGTFVGDFSIFKLPKQGNKLIFLLSELSVQIKSSESHHKSTYLYYWKKGTMFWLQDDWKLALRFVSLMGGIRLSCVWKRKG